MAARKSISIEALRNRMLFYGVNPVGDTLEKVPVEQCSIFRNKKGGNGNQVACEDTEGGLW